MHHAEALQDHALLSPEVVNQALQGLFRLQWTPPFRDTEPVARLLRALSQSLVYLEAPQSSHCMQRGVRSLVTCRSLGADPAMGTADVAVFQGQTGKGCQCVNLKLDQGVSLPENGGQILERPLSLV